MTTEIRQRLALLTIWLLCQIAAVIASLWMLIAALAGSRRAWTLAVAHDQLANAAFGGPVCSAAYSTGSIPITARSPSSTTKVSPSLDPVELQSPFTRSATGGFFTPGDSYG